MLYRIFTEGGKIMDPMGLNCGFENAIRGCAHTLNYFHAKTKADVTEAKTNVIKH